MSDQTASSLSRRVRALAHLVPVLILERDRNMGSSGRDWSCYDPKLLAVHCVDELALSSGLTGAEGVPRAVLVDGLTHVAARSAPDRPADEHREVANWLLDRLLAVGTGSRSHLVEWTDPDRDYSSRTERVRLMYEQIGIDETVEVVLDDAAVHLLMIGLDVDIEDAQIAIDAVFKHQMESGRLDEARASSQKALRLTRQYQRRIDRLLSAARRDLSSIDWAADVAPELHRARSHVEDRLDYERSLHRHANEGRSSLDTDPDQAAIYDDIVTMIDDCIAMLTKLNGQLAKAIDVYLEEQPRQLFNSSVPLDAVDLPGTVLDPLLCSSPDTDVLDIALHLFGPVNPRMLDLGALDDLVRPPVEPEDAPLPDEGELRDVAALIDGLDDRHYELLDELLDSHVGADVRLSNLLADVPTGDRLFHDQMTMLCGLAALQGFVVDGDPTDAPSRIVAHDDGTVLDHDLLNMPDLLLEVHPA